MTVPTAHQPSQQRGAWDVTSPRSRRSGPPGPRAWSLCPPRDSFSTQPASPREQIGLQCREAALCWSETARRWSRAHVKWGMSVLEWIIPASTTASAAVSTVPLYGAVTESSTRILAANKKRIALAQLEWLNLESIAGRSVVRQELSTWFSLRRSGWGAANPGWGQERSQPCRD